MRWLIMSYLIWIYTVCKSIILHCRAEMVNANYHIYPKYLDTVTPWYTCSEIWKSAIYYLLLCLKIAGWVANSVDPGKTLHSAVSHLGLHCLLRSVCPNTYGNYSIQICLSKQCIPRSEQFDQGLYCPTFSQPLLRHIIKWSKWTCSEF